MGGRASSPPASWSGQTRETRIAKVTDRKVKTAQPGKHEDGEGLRLVVSPAGTRKWVLRLTVAGRRREMGLPR